MVLDDDVNGFKARMGGGKREGGGKKKGKKVCRYTRSPSVHHSTCDVQNKNQQALAVWDPNEQYDPMRPNDYNEFKMWQRK